MRTKTMRKLCVNGRLPKPKSNRTVFDVSLGWEGLAVAIIQQACKDYKSSESPKWLVEDAKKFFMSEWFKSLTSINGEALLKRLQRYRQNRFGGNDGNSDYAKWI